MSYKIEKGVPIPKRGQAKYPFDRMQIGDSFVVIDPKEAKNAQEAASHYGRRNGMKFTARKQDDGSTRIWRTD